SRLAFDGAASAVVVVYGESPEHRPSLMHAVTAALEQEGIGVMEALHVRDGRWWSYTCSRPCCPPEGTALPPPADLLAARAARAAEQRLDAALVTWLRDVEERGRDTAHRDAVDAFRSALASSTVDDETAAALAVSLQDVNVRDEVATLAIDDSESLLTLLLA